MDLYPAIDLRSGRVVRLAQGEANRQVVYGDDPAAQALAFVEAGARWIHVVDLDRAFGSGENNQSVTSILSMVAGRASIQVGGGVRSLDRALELAALGVDRIVIGTAAVEHPELIDQLTSALGAARVAVGIDAREGLVAVRGWVDTSGVRATELAARVSGQGIDAVIYTDIARDGMLRGPDLDGAVAVHEAMAQSIAPNVIVSGGISNVSDLEQVAAIGLGGAIIGRALYEGHFTLRDALATEHS